MTDVDIELLKLAAKAVGVNYDEAASVPHPKSGAFFGLWLTFDDEPSEHARRYWNPLTNDGDALRLTVRLRLELSWWKTGVSAESPDHVPVGIQPFNDNPAAATRRAIVRAAAAIGEAQAEWKEP